MRQVSAALRAAIDAGERVVRSVFTVDWDNDGVQDLDDLTHQIGRVSATQSLESSLPAQVQVVPGVAVAELTASVERGNRFRYDVPVTLRGVTSASSGSGTVTTITVPRPSDAREGDIMLLSVFISGNPVTLGIGGQFAYYDITRGTNVPWVVMSVRGDGVSFSDTAYARVEGVLLARRVTSTEPSIYTISVPPDGVAVFVGSAVNIGDQNIIGITDFDTKGEDGVDNPTSVVMPPVTVDLPGSMIVSFYAASSYLVSGSSFSPSTTDDVEQVELATTYPPVSGAANVRMAVMTTANPARGRQQKSAIYTSSGSLTSTVGFVVVLGPKLAGDESQHAAWMMSELNPDSPYAGKMRIRRPVRWDLYFVTESGFERVPLFTGFTTTTSGTSRNRSAEIRALDNRENLRGTRQGMDVVAESPVARDEFLGLPFMPGLESTWVVSKLLFYAFYRSTTNGVFSFENQSPLRNGLGYFASPLANKFSFLWVPFHGSAHPLVGDVYNAYVESPTLVRSRFEFDPGPFVSATRALPSGTSLNATWIGFAEGYSSQTWHPTTGQLAGRIQHWLKRGTRAGYCFITITDTVPGNSPTYTCISRIAPDGSWSFRVTQPGGVSRIVVGPSVPEDDNWHFIGVHFNSITGSVTFRIDSTNTVVAMATWVNTTPSVGFENVVTMYVGDGASIAELQVAGSFDQTSGLQVGISLTDAWANDNFVPTAFIDKSDNVLDCVPVIDSAIDAFNVIAAISDAEFSAFFFDADGYPHYRNTRSNVTTTGQTVQKQITARRSLEDLRYESGVQQIANIISVSWTEFLPVVNGEAYRANGVITIPAGTGLSFTVMLPGPVFDNQGVTFSANSAIDGTGTDLSSYISTSITSTEPYSVTFTVNNDGPITAFLVDGSGQPDLVVIASWMAPQTNTSMPATYTDATSIRKYGEQALPTIGANEWMQRYDSAASLALTLLSDLADAKPVLTSVPIKGDPTLEFGDLVTIVDSFGLGVNGLYRITGKDPSHTVSDGFSQNLVVRQAATVAYWDTNSWDDGTVWG